MRKSMFFVLTIVTLCSLVLSGCGTKATPAATTAPETAAPATAAPTAVPPTVETTHEPVTLKYMDYSQERLDFYKQASVEFNKVYPWITVVPETMVEDDYKQTLPLAFQGGSSPISLITPGLTAIWVQPFAAGRETLVSLFPSAGQDEYAGEVERALLMYLAPAWLTNGAQAGPSVASAEKGKLAFDAVVKATVEYIEHSFTQIDQIKG